MTAEFTIFAVDDDKLMRALLQSALADRYALEIFDSGESCLQRLTEKQPDLFLLDVELPKMSGYELCRRLKQRPKTAAIPLMFISGHDDPACILAGYEAGGEDYILKPINIAGMRRKVELLRQLHESQVARSVQTGTAQSGNDGEGALLDFFHSLNLCMEASDVGAALLHVGEILKLELTIQVIAQGKSNTLSRKGENWPLEVAAIKHVRGQGRLYRSPQLAAWNFPRLTLLASNLPDHQAEISRRLCRQLEIAAESADCRLHSLDAFRQLDNCHTEISTLLARAHRGGADADFDGMRLLQLEELQQSLARLMQETKQKGE